MAELQLGTGGTEEKPKAPDGLTTVDGDGKTTTVVVDSSTATEDAAQAAREAAEGKSTPPCPEGFPEKFWTGDAAESNAKLLAAYGELESKQGKGKTEEKPKTEEKETKEEKGGESSLKIVKAPESKMVDFEIAEKEWVENDGVITPETYAAYEKMGLSKQHVDGYIAGQQAQVAKMETTLHEVAGDSERMTQVLQWALDEVDADDIAVYNDAIDAGNVAQAKVALKGIVAEYNAANGESGNLIEGDTSVTSGGSNGYGSVAEMTQAMQDPRYQTDRAYRAKVIQRVDASKF